MNVLDRTDKHIAELKADIERLEQWFKDRDGIECPFYTVQKQRFWENNPRYPIRDTFECYKPQCWILKRNGNCPFPDCYEYTVNLL